MSNSQTAYFVERPYQISDLMRLHLPKQRKAFVVKKIITLNKTDYENFINDFTVDRWFIEEYKQLCFVDKNDVWHCILVKQKGKEEGVLVMSDGNIFPKWAAYYY